MMAMAAQGITQGTMTVGDFVLVNAYLLQLYQPLNFFGFIYSEVRRALIDMENMFDLLQEKREIVDSRMPSRCASIAAKCGSMRSASVTTRAGRSSNR